MKTNSHRFELTHVNKILFPREGISKGDMIAYYEAIADHMLPFMVDRPLTMQRFVNGIQADSFFQKDGSNFPSWITKKAVKKKDGGTTNYVICNNKETLLYLANQNCITTHLWLSTTHEMKKPDRLIFDLDPSVEGFSLVKQTAIKLKELLETLGLVSFAMTTGSRGVHVVVPLIPQHTYAFVKNFAVDIAKLLIANDSENLTMNLTKQKRGSKLFIDTLRNQYGATAVSPYSIRALNNAPVATPITWNELKELSNAQAYTITTLFNRLKKVKNPWPGFFELKQNLEIPTKLLLKMNTIKKALKK